jgi:hypothetical protein
LDLREPFTIGFGVCPLLVQSVLFCDKALNMIENRLVFGLLFHGSLLSRGYDENGHKFMLRPSETVVNRCSAQQDDSGIDCQKKKIELGTISRRAAGI